VPVFAAVVPPLSDRLLARRPVIAALSLMVAFSSWQIVRAFPRSDQSLSAWLNRNGPDAPNYPCFAADFVDRNVTGKTHHLLCDLTWGGFSRMAAGGTISNADGWPHPVVHQRILERRRVGFTCRAPAIPGRCSR